MLDRKTEFIRQAAMGHKNQSRSFTKLLFGEKQADQVRILSKRARSASQKAKKNA